MASDATRFKAFVYSVVGRGTYHVNLPKPFVAKLGALTTLLFTIKDDSRIVIRPD